MICPTIHHFTAVAVGSLEEGLVTFSVDLEPLMYSYSDFTRSNRTTASPALPG